MNKDGGPSPISDYALLGDGETAALVDRTGSIDWLCWPRFDSDACFAALLGDERHGFWRICPTVPYKTRRRYTLGLILETVFETEAGEVAVTDFMPPHADHTFSERSHLVRIVRGLGGKVPMRMDLVLRFGYGATTPWVTRTEDGGLSAIAGPSMVLLRASAETRGENMTTVAEFEIAAGEEKPFVLTHQASHLPPHPPIDPHLAMERAETFWTAWVDKCQVTGPYAEAVLRSLITLKGLIYAPTGGVVAAPTTSLPEEIGGERNWDYRFCWVRDATLALLALMNAGHYEEAERWRDWLLRAVAGDPADMQIMYGIGGERRLGEWTADWLPGYAGS